MITAATVVDRAVSHTESRLGDDVRSTVQFVTVQRYRQRHARSQPVQTARPYYIHSRSSLSLCLLHVTLVSK